MYQFLRKPRWIVLLILVPLLVVLFFRLSEWQRERYEGRNDANAIIERTLAIPAATLSEVLSENHSEQSPAQWRQVHISGTYLVDQEVLVRKKPMQGAVGYWVVTPLKLNQAITVGGFSTDQAPITRQTINTVLVNRGWIPPAPTPNTSPKIPAPPTGDVTITGRVQEMQPNEALPADLPEGQVLHVNPGEMALPKALTVAPIFVNLQASNPPQQGTITPLPEPEIDSGPHLSYALQWIAFAIILSVGIVILIRREAHTGDSDSFG